MPIISGTAVTNDTTTKTITVGRALAVVVRGSGTFKLLEDGTTALEDGDTATGNNPLLIARHLNPGAGNVTFKVINVNAPGDNVSIEYRAV